MFDGWRGGDACSAGGGAASPGSTRGASAATKGLAAAPRPGKEAAVARAPVALALAALTFGLASPARAADPPAGAPAARRNEPTRASQPPLRGDEATLRTGEPPMRLERVESENYPPSSVRFPTLLGGVGLVGAFWGLGLATSSAFPDDPGMNDLRVPVAGPWVAFANNRCDDGGCSLGDVVRYVWFTLNGIGQAGGVALVLQGALLRTGGEAPAAADPAPRRGPLVPPEASPPPGPGGDKPLFFVPLPTVVGRDGLGVGWGGVF